MTVCHYVLSFHSFMTEVLANSPSVKVVKYTPDIHDVRVASDIAY
jgi:hypothetical protein